MRSGDGMFAEAGGGLECHFLGELLRIEPWGADALRVRARPGGRLVPGHVDALLPAPEGAARVEIGEGRATIERGRIRAVVTLTDRLGADVKREAVVRFERTDTGAELLAETRSHFAGPRPRSFKALASGSWRLEQCFRAYEGEALWGMGQPQHGAMNLKGVSTTSMQQNAHVAIPFVVSSRGYGLLWNNPAVGRAEFARNVSRWTAEATGGLDYWITAGDAPAEIVRAYAQATGRAPEVPAWVLGFWQSKLRYRTQDELMGVAREYRRRGLPLSCIVIGFFAWTRQGEWRFDPADWPDPEGMVAELKGLGVEVMVSIWPTVSAASEHYREMTERGMLLTAERGVPALIPFPDKDPFGPGFFTYYDAFSPEARAFHLNLVRRNYVDRGIRHFWLDACEPEMRPAHPEHVRTSLGNGAEMLCAYPLVHEAGHRAMLDEAGAGDGVLLCRSAWAGAQRHGVILWSGDVWSDWSWFRAQIPAGLHAGMSGIGWWTTDIGGFYEGHGGSAEFRELLVRWFEFGALSPVCRLHGFRVPETVPPPAPGERTGYGGDTFGLFTSTGGDNEVWSYGPEVEAALTGLLALRERLRPYLEAAFRHHSRTGDPVMAPLFYHFPDDPALHDRADAYMLSADLLVAPVLEPGATAREVSLPRGEEWVHAWTGTRHGGGTSARVDAPWGCPPVFARADAWDALAPVFADGGPGG